ncbi:MAG: TIGR04282 family arsenosugar biosynthesis glycosyltransferase [Bdellovibrionota bacterium]
MEIESSHGAVVIMAKLPFLGNVKTRLASSVGQPIACELAQAFVQDLMQKLNSFSEVDRYLAIDFSMIGMASWNGFHVFSQGKGDLGQRLHQVGERLLDSHPWIVFLGADTPHLSMDCLDFVIQSMRKNDLHRCVIGPSHDGGFYVLGLSSIRMEWFQGISWSTNKVFDQVTSNLKQHFSTIDVLDHEYDIDTRQDLDRLANILTKNPDVAPHTVNVIRKGIS